MPGDHGGSPNGGGGGAKAANAARESKAITIASRRDALSRDAAARRAYAGVPTAGVKLVDVVGARFARPEHSVIV